MTTIKKPRKRAPGVLSREEFNAKRRASCLMDRFGTTDILEILGPAGTIPPTKLLSEQLATYGMSRTLAIHWAKTYIPEELYAKLKPYQVSLGLAKQHATCVAKYGCESPLGNTEVQRKKTATNNRIHGGNAPACDAAVLKKMADTNEKRYGGGSPTCDPLVREKQIKTLTQRYGGAGPLSSPDVLARMQQTCLERYGGPFKALSPEEVLRRLSAYGLEPLEPITSTSDKHKTIRVRCQHCGREFTTRWTSCAGDHYNGVGLIVCECQTHGTNLQHFVRDYIRSLGYTCDQWSHIDWLDNKEIDCFIPELNTGFEVNGYLTHNSEWNPYDNSPKATSYHKAKSEACLAHGIKLYHIWHIANTLEEQAVAKHIVDKALGIYTRRVFARKCKLEETTFADIRDFLDTYHMHGAIPANKYFKLTLDGETLQVMTFKRVTGTVDTWELSRLATKHGVQVIGGSAKLFKHALPTLEGCKQLVSYAYRDFTPDPEDSVYTRLGFKFDSFTQPGLSFYAQHPIKFPSGVTISAGVYSRQKFQAHKLAAIYGCKTQDLPYLGLYKTFDSGNLKFVYKL